MFEDCEDSAGVAKEAAALEAAFAEGRDGGRREHAKPVRYNAFMV
jgi:hypothetical protein